ncbi:hypothetical protein RR48_00670 [Papilio machaon]|uniref:Uncharacterized protein n=1 Tax=Papilio machaon TaxID=76193 RepID=A0A0N1PIE6_PAPMA|nr:hypothetical protein RR48_00670 [Papilio machaon]
MSRDLLVCPVRVNAEHNTAYYTRESNYLHELSSLSEIPRPYRRQEESGTMSPKRLAKETKTVTNKQIDTSLGSTELTE